MRRRNGKERRNPERVEFVRGRGLLFPIDLVDRVQYGRCAAPEQIDGPGVRGIHALPAVEQKDDQIRLGNSQPGLFLHAADHAFGLGRVDAAGIHDDEAVVPPTDAGEHAVASHARGIVHYGLTPAIEAVEQR